MNNQIRVRSSCFRDLMQLMDHPPARRRISVVLVTLILAMVPYSQGQDVVTLPEANAAALASPDAYSSSGAAAAGEAMLAQVAPSTDATLGAAASMAAAAAAASDSSSEAVADVAVDVDTMSAGSPAALKPQLPKGEKEVILLLGFKRNSQLDYGGRHITIATFKGKQDSTSSYKEMTRERVSQWLNSTKFKCGDNLATLQTSAWKLSSSACQKQKVTTGNVTCSCIGHKTGSDIECGDHPWNLAKLNYDKPAYTVILKSRRLDALAKCLNSLQNLWTKTSSVKATALKDFGIMEMETKGPLMVNGSTGTPWHVAMYNNTAYATAKTEYQNELLKGSDWEVYWNDYTYKQGSATPPCPDPTVDAPKPAGNPGAPDGTNKYKAPFCWLWTRQPAKPRSG